MLLQDEDLRTEVGPQYINLADEIEIDNEDVISAKSSQSGKSNRTHNFQNLAKSQKDEDDLEDFFAAERQYMVITNAGKPVFSLNGDIYSLAPIFATLYAMISKHSTFRFKQNLIEEPSPKKKGKQKTQTFDDMTNVDDEDDCLNNSVLQSMQTVMKQTGNSGKDKKIVVVTKGSCLIYIALSCERDESTSFLRKQLEFLHLQLISVTTRQVITMLVQNPSFDLMNEMWTGLPLLRRLSQYVHKSLQTFLNMYLPLRMDKQTREHVDFVISRTKPPQGTFYFGILLAKNTVVAIFRTSNKITIQPADVNLVLNFVTAHSSNLQKRAPCFVNMCLPGLTEDYKMSCFFNSSKPDHSLRLVIVAEEATVKMMDKFELISNSIFQQLNLEMTTKKILLAEKAMFDRQNMREIVCLVIANTHLDQFTCYNCLDAQQLQQREPSPLAIQYIKTVREFEKLHHVYLGSVSRKKKKEELFIKKKTHHYTYALLAKGDIVVMGSIAHDHTSREVGDILKDRLNMAKTDTDQSFHWKQY